MYMYVHQLTLTAKMMAFALYKSLGHSLITWYSVYMYIHAAVMKTMYCLFPFQCIHKLGFCGAHTRTHCTTFAIVAHYLKPIQYSCIACTFKFYDVTTITYELEHACS